MRSGVFITCGLLLLSGCAHGNGGRFAANSSRTGLPTGANDRAKMVEKLLDHAPVPPRSPVPLLRAQSQDNPGIALTSTSAAKTPVVSHDATTLALIEKETRTFSPEDRERAVAALKAIPSESVPAVLQLWKAGLISPLAHPSSPVILAPATAADLPPPTALARHEATQTDSSLGQKSPWQGQDVQQANYVTQGPEGNEIRQIAFSESTPRSQQIPRVNTPTAGYSSPFDNQTTSQNAASGAIGFTEPGRGSWGSDRNFDSIPAYNPNSPAPVMPADWPDSSGTFAVRSSTGNRGASSFSNEPSRQLIIPPDWQSHIAPRPAAVNVAALPPIAPAPAFRPNPAPLIAGVTPPETNDGPIIRPLRRGPPVETGAPAQSNFEQVGFSNPPALPGTGERGLLPGQPLSGMEDASRVVQLSNQVDNHVAALPDNISLERGGSLASVPPPAALQSSGDALQFLIRATEAETSRLNPGQTAEELQYYIQRQVYLRLLYLMADQSESALRPIPRIPAADQEFWTQVVWGVHNYFDVPGIPNHAERAAQTIYQFNTAMLRLKERAPLELSHVSFCHAIHGYGEFETFSKDEFAPGKRVLVYAEINNFHSELSAEGIYRTRLKSTLQVVSADAPQEPVEVKVYPVTEDFCRNHRRDYFHSYVVEIPIRCARGSHVLKLIVEDELSGKVATHSLPFVVR